MKIKQNILIWIFFLIPSFIFVYQITNKDELERFNLMDLQFIEFLSIFVFSILIVFFENYKKIKNFNLRFLLFFVIFLLLSTVQYEFLSIYVLVIHGLCYFYLFIILGMITLNNKDEDE